MGSFLGVVAGGLLIGETLALTGMVYDVLRRRGHLSRDGPRAARAARADSSARRGCPRSERPGPGRAGAGHRAALRRLHAVLPRACSPRCWSSGSSPWPTTCCSATRGCSRSGHSAFLGVAAYVTGILLARFHAPARAEHPGRGGGRAGHVGDPRSPGSAKARRLSGDAHPGAVAGLLLHRAHVDAGDRRHRRARQPAHPLPERAPRLAAVEAADHPVLRDRDLHLRSRCSRSVTCSARRSGG